MAPGATTLGELEGRSVHAWHVRQGQLWLELDDRGVAVQCDCGHTHVLLTEALGGHLLLRCHACGRRCEVQLA